VLVVNSEDLAAAMDQAKQELDEINRLCCLYPTQPLPDATDVIHSFFRIAASCGSLECQPEHPDNRESLVFTVAGMTVYPYHMLFQLRTWLATLAFTTHRMLNPDAPILTLSPYGFEAVINYLGPEGIVSLHIKTLNSGHNSVPKPNYYFCIQRQ
jgi:hypothetical protein